MMPADVLSRGVENKVGLEFRYVSNFFGCGTDQFQDLLKLNGHINQLRLS